MFPIADFLIYCVINAYTPGANNLLSMSNAARSGFRNSLPFNLGITLGFFFVMSICMFFTATLHDVIVRMQIVMQILGSAYMLYLAWKCLRSSSDLAAGQAAEGFLSGMLLQFVNPKIYIYAVTAISLYILPVCHSAAAYIGFVFVLTLIGASGSYAWALFGSFFRKLFVLYPKIVNSILAILLVYCAAALWH